MYEKIMLFYVRLSLKKHIFAFNESVLESDLKEK